MTQTSPGRLHDEVVRVARDLIRIDTTNGNETEAAEYLAGYLTDAVRGTPGAARLEVELVARDPRRANLLARLKREESQIGAEESGIGREGSQIGAEGSLAYVGHLDVVPADPRDWTHPPFAAVIDEAGYLFGRGAVDMKNEVAARAVAIAELARCGFAPQADLWLAVVADEEDGNADVGMRWLLEERPDFAPSYAVNEGGGQRLELTDGRSIVTISVGEKGTQPVRVVALGEAGHASMPTIGDNAVPKLGPLLERIGRGLATTGESPLLDATLVALLGARGPDLVTDLERASALHPVLAHSLPTMAGTTMAPTLLGGSAARNVMPARAWVELDCRILPGATPDEVLTAVRERLGNATSYELELPEAMIPGSSSAFESRVVEAARAFLAEHDPATGLVPVLCTGFTDSSFIRAVRPTEAYGFSPFRTTPVDVVEAGYHNADERIHVDDLAYSVAFHLDLARRLLS